MGSRTEVIAMPGNQNAKYHRRSSPYSEKSARPTWRSIDETFSRVPATDIDDIPGCLPEAQIPEGVDFEAIAKDALDQLCTHNTMVFDDQVLWRDVFALTGTLRTFHGTAKASVAWKDLSELHAPYNFTTKAHGACIKRTDSQHSWVHIGFTFHTDSELPSKCSGWLGLVPRDGGWKIWLLCTVLEELVSMGSPDTLSNTVSTTNSVHNNASSPSKDVHDCVVVGAGFGGLCVAGRLKALDVNCLVIDQQSKIGDNWLDRYDSARFHTSKWYSDLPVEQVFDDSYDYFLSARELAKGYQTYVDRLGIDVSLSTQLTGAEYNSTDGIWSLRIKRLGKLEELQTRHVVLAIGAGSGQIPWMPELPARDKFKGIVLHSKYYKNCQDWKGLKGVVVGAANTAHDVAEDMLDAGLLEVTMLQRGATPVFPIEYYSKWADPLYNKTSSIEDADREIMAMPLAVTRFTTRFGMCAMAATQPERFDALERAGFKLDRSLDLWKCLTKRHGGHYMDIGGSAKIAKGLIKMKSDAALESYTENGLTFGDGSHIEADVVIFCTGFSNEYRNEAVKLVGASGADKMNDYWLLDSEGELRGAYKPQGYPGIWYTGGGVTHARFYSRFVALQIKADLFGTPLPVYKS